MTKRDARAAALRWMGMLAERFEDDGSMLSGFSEGDADRLRYAFDHVAAELHRQADRLGARVSGVDFMGMFPAGAKIEPEDAS